MLFDDLIAESAKHLAPQPVRALHNDLKVDLKDATNAQLEASIAWYQEHIQDPDTPEGFREQIRGPLAHCEAERSNRVGKATAQKPQKTRPNFRKIGDNFHWTKMGAKNLVGVPQLVKGNFYCNGTDLQSLKGAPKVVGGDFACDNNDLETLEGAPEEIGGRFTCYGNHLKSLEGIPKAASYFLPNGFKEEDARKEVEKRRFRKGLDKETLGTFGDFIDEL